MAAKPAFIAQLQAQGFVNITVEDLRWRVAPSVAYVPWTTVKFFARALWQRQLFQLTAWQWKNLVSPWLTMLLGLQTQHFGYYLITAQKPFTP